MGLMAEWCCRCGVATWASETQLSGRIPSVVLRKLDMLFREHLTCVSPVEWMCSVTAVAFDVEHDLADQFFL